MRKQVVSEISLLTAARKAFSKSQGFKDIPQDARLTTSDSWPMVDLMRQSNLQVLCGEARKEKEQTEQNQMQEEGADVQAY